MSQSTLGHNPQRQENVITLGLLASMVLMGLGIVGFFYGLWLPLPIFGDAGSARIMWGEHIPVTWVLFVYLAVMLLWMAASIALALSTIKWVTR